MEKSNLFRLIQSFEPVERREVVKFLQSPFFNQRQDVIALFHLLGTEQVPDKSKVWSKIYSGKAYDDQKMRHLMSYLHQLLEDFLMVQETIQDTFNYRLKLSMAYRKRGMNAAFEKKSKQHEKLLEEQPLRNLSYFEIKHKSLWEAHQLNYASNPTDISRLYEISQTADIIYITEKLKLICLLAAHQSIYKSTINPLEEEAVIRLAQENTYRNIPVVAIFLDCYHMLRYPDEEQHFYGLKALLPVQTGRFTEEEMHSFYILAINYCVKKINAGQEHMIAQVFDIYKEALEKNYLMEEGVLSRFTYHNIVAAGLSIEDTEWVRFFIHQYKNRVEKQHRESSYSYNLARLEYACKGYHKVMDLLQKANYRDPLLNLQAKTLLIKTYYDLTELDLLQSHLDAMRNYIHRKAILGYHRTNYLNIIRYTEKLIRINPGDKAGIVALRSAIEQEETLTERLFFLTRLVALRVPES